MSETSTPPVRYAIELVDGMPPEPTRSGALVPPWAQVTVNDIYRLVLDVHLVHGAAICTRLEVEQLPDGPPIMQTALGKIPIARHAQQAIAYAAAHASEPDEAGGLHARRDVVEALTVELAPRRKGRAADPGARAQLRREVVRRYEELVLAGSTRPKPPIAAALNISTSYMSALLAEARRLGELPDSVRPSASQRRGQVTTTPTDTSPPTG